MFTADINADVKCMKRKKKEMCTQYPRLDSQTTRMQTHMVVERVQNHYRDSNSNCFTHGYVEKYI